MRASGAPILAAAAVALALPAAANAQLGLPIPDPIQTITQVTDQVTGGLPNPVGGIVDTVTGTVGQTVDQVLGGTLEQLPLGTVDDLLGSAGLNGANGANGANGQPGVTTLPNGTVLIDKRPPTTKVKVLNRNRTVGRNGKLRIQISSDEPSVVALVGTVRPGRAWRLHGKAAKRHSRKSIKVPKVLLGYRQAGTLKLTIQFSRRAQRNIRGSFNSAVKLTLVAVDVAHNQVTRKLNRVVKH